MKGLKVGSKYVFYVAVSREDLMVTSGTFVGYRLLGEDAAVCVKLDETHGEKKGQIRIIPISFIAAIDIVEENSESETTEDIYYS